MARALRRHHLTRVKLKRLRQIKINNFDENVDSKNLIKMVGRRAHTGAQCSCWLCGNPRKFWNEVTIQERKNERFFKAELIRIL